MEASPAAPRRVWRTVLVGIVLVVSTLVFLAASAVWIRSNFVAEEWTWTRTAATPTTFTLHRNEIRTAHGVIQMASTHREFTDPASARHMAAKAIPLFSYDSARPEYIMHEFGAFTVFARSNALPERDGSIAVTEVMFSCWIACLASGVAPGWWVVRRIRRRRPASFPVAVSASEPALASDSESSPPRHA